MGRKNQQCRIFDSQVLRIVKSMETINMIITVIGLILLIIKAFIFPQQDKFLVLLDEFFTFLIASEIIVIIFTKYWNISNKILNIILEPRNSSKFNIFRIIIFEIYISCIKSWDCIHFILIFIQPNVLFSRTINWHLYNLAPIRVYIVIRYCMLNQFFFNPSFVKVCKVFQLNHVIYAIKVAYKKHFVICVIVLTFMLIIGFGNLIKDQSQNLLQNIFIASYFIVITFSTVGYGDYLPDDIFSKLMTIVILIFGQIIIAFLIYTLQKQIGPNLQELIVCHQLKTLKHKQNVKNIISERVLNLIQMNCIQQQILSHSNDVIQISNTQTQKKFNDLTQPSLLTFKQFLFNLTIQQKQMMACNKLFSKTLHSFQNNTIFQDSIQCIKNSQYLKQNNPLIILTFKDKLIGYKNKMFIFQLINQMFLRIIQQKDPQYEELRHFNTRKIYDY